MPSRIYEYPLPRTVDEMHLFVPTGSIPRHVGIGSKNKPKIWIEVPQGSASTVVIKLRNILSYSPIPPDYKYIGSYSSSNTVFHVYGIETTAEAVKAEIIHGAPQEKVTSKSTPKSTGRK